MTQYWRKWMHFTWKTQLLLQTLNTIVGEFRTNSWCFKAQEEERRLKLNRFSESQSTTWTNLLWTEDVSQLHSNLYKCHHLAAEYNEKLEWYDITLPFRQNTKEHCETCQHTEMRGRRRGLQLERELGKQKAISLDTYVTVHNSYILNK